jgi:hypothetical protein
LDHFFKSFKEEAKQMFGHKNVFGQFKNCKIWLSGGFGPILKKVESKGQSTMWL